MIKLCLFDVGGTINTSMDIGLLARKLDYSDVDALQEFCRMHVFGAYDLEPDPYVLLRAVKDFTGSDKSCDEIWEIFRDCRGGFNLSFLKALDFCRSYHIKTGLLTNVSGIYTEDNLFLCEYLKIPYIFQSCDLHLVKPKMDIYEYVELSTGYYSQDIIFIDDCEDNLRAPRELGWYTAKVSADKGESLCQPIVDIVKQFI